LGEHWIVSHGINLPVGVSQPTLIALECEGRGRVHTLDRVLRVLGAGAYLAPRGSVRPFYTHAGNSSGHQAWRTPDMLLSRLYGVFGRFDLDPCSPVADRRRAPVKARVRYKGNGRDGARRHNEDRNLLKTRT
jgi:hypothetical protein